MQRGSTTESKRLKVRLKTVHVAWQIPGGHATLWVAGPSSAAG